MIGLLVELALSWVLLWLLQKKNMSVLGFRPRWDRLKGFLLLLLVGLACGTLSVGLRVLFFKEAYTVNPAFDGKLLWGGFRWHLVSVLYEELIFRGALLYILISRIGAAKAIAVSAIAFGIYHWFSFGIVGAVPAMIQAFIITGIMGVVLAYSYARSGSLYMAIGLHLGWNFTSFLVSRGSIGKGWLVQVVGQPDITVSYFTYYAVTLLPLVLVYMVSYWTIRRLSATPATHRHTVVQPCVEEMSSVP